jgi:caffeoyl-CoA O-methyltransferase
MIQETMFHDIPSPILEVMRMLESIDARDRADGTTRLERLRQIPPETGRFIALLAGMAPDGPLIEIGTSAGYSALWLALACRDLGRKLTTFEILSEKATIARETFRAAKVEDIVELVEGDALKQLEAWEDISFCFLDAEKEIYYDCYELVIPKMIPGGILIADNAINHALTLQPMIDRALADGRVDSMVVPIGRGELFCRKR